MEKWREDWGHWGQCKKEKTPSSPPSLLQAWYASDNARNREEVEKLMYLSSRNP